MEPTRPQYTGLPATFRAALGPLQYRTVRGASVELLPGTGHSRLLENPLRAATSLPAFPTLHSVRVN